MPLEKPDAAQGLCQNISKLLLSPDELDSDFLLLRTDG